MKGRPSENYVKRSKVEGFQNGAKYAKIVLVSFALLQLLLYSFRRNHSDGPDFKTLVLLLFMAVWMPTFN